MGNSATPYHVPQQSGRWQAIALAVIVHAALFAFLWFGINWSNEKPESLEVDGVFSQKELDAAATAPPAPTHIPPKVSEADNDNDAVEAPPPKVKVVKPPPPKEEDIPKPDDDAIRLEQEKIRLKKERAKQRADEIAKQKEAKEAREAEEAKKADAAKIAKEKQTNAEKHKQDELAQQQATKAAHDAEVARLTGGAKTNTSDHAGSHGNQADDAWLSKVKAKIKSNVDWPGNNDVDKPVRFTLRLLPDGELGGTPSLVQSSGNTRFDDVIREAIKSSQPFPRNKDGSVPSPVTINYSLKDLQ